MSVLITKFSIEIKIKKRYFGDSVVRMISHWRIFFWKINTLRGKNMTIEQTKTECWDPTISGGSCIGAQPCCDKGFLLGISGRKHQLMPCCSSKSDKFYLLLQEPWATVVPLLQHPCCLSLSCMLLLFHSRSSLASSLSSTSWLLTCPTSIVSLLVSSSILLHLSQAIGHSHACGWTLL